MVEDSAGMPSMASTTGEDRPGRRQARGALVGLNRRHRGGGDDVECIGGERLYWCSLSLACPLKLRRVGWWPPWCVAFCDVRAMCESGGKWQKVAKVKTISFVCASLLG